MTLSNRILVACAFAAGLAGALPARADSWGTMSPEQYEAAEKRIAAQRKADDQACKRLKDHARAVCAAQAKGREKAALAALEAEDRPSPEAERAAKEARAEAAYAVAKVRCKAVAKDTRERCEDRARHALEAAVRQAKVEKVRQLDALKRQKEEQAKAGETEAARKGS